MRPKCLGILACSVFTAFLVVCGCYYGPQTITYFRLRPMLLRSPDDPPRGWSSVPHPLEDLSTSAAGRNVVSQYGYRFEVPWGDIKSERGDGLIELQTGQRIRFLDPQIGDGEPISPQTIHSSASDFARIFGTSMHDSKYDQFTKIMSAVPPGWSPLQSRSEFQRYGALLQIKGLWFEHNPMAPSIYSFQTKNYHGFEVSGLPRGWQNVTLHFFDLGNHWFVINIQGDELHGVKITQPEINRVIQSFGPIQPGTSAK